MRRNKIIQKSAFCKIYKVIGPGKDIQMIWKLLGKTDGNWMFIRCPSINSNTEIIFSYQGEIILPVVINNFTMGESSHYHCNLLVKFTNGVMRHHVSQCKMRSQHHLWWFLIKNLWIGSINPIKLTSSL